MKHVIVTGATGFLGRALVNRLRERFGAPLSFVAMGTNTVDLANRSATFDWFDAFHRGNECDHILHLAALYRAGDWPIHHPATQFHANMSITVNVLEAWARFLPKAKLTAVVPYCVYPTRSEPLAESDMWGTEPEPYLFAFGATRKALVIGQRAYRQERGLSSTTVVLPTLFGPGDSFAENSHVVGALIGKFVRGTKLGHPEVEVWGTGAQEREFLHVRDAADAIILAAERGESPVLNMGTGQTHSIAFIAETIRRAAGFPGVLRFDTSKFVGVARRVLDSSLAKAELDWQPSISLESGLAQTVAWYQSSS